MRVFFKAPPLPSVFRILLGGFSLPSSSARFSFAQPRVLIFPLLSSPCAPLLFLLLPFSCPGVHPTSCWRHVLTLSLLFGLYFSTAILGRMETPIRTRIQGSAIFGKEGGSLLRHGPHIHGVEGRLCHGLSPRQRFGDACVSRGGPATTL